MANNNIISNVLKIIVLISGIVLFVLQICSVWDNFVMKRTAFGTSQKTLDKIPIPPITLCPEILDIDMSIVDPDLFLDQFYKLNEEIRIRVAKSNDFEKDLQQGQNFDQHGELLVTLRELWHPYMGLCYVLDPNTRRLNFGVEDAFMVSIFLKGKKGNAIKVLLHNKENIEFVNFPDFGRQTPVISTLDGGTNTGMDLRKSFRQQMSSKGKHFYLGMY